MIFRETVLRGSFLLAPKRHTDERGFFARAFCREKLIAHGLHADFPQCNISFNIRRGTVRGLHYQTSPMEEVKIVRCTSGAICDVILDMRQESSTYLQWISLKLTAQNRLMLYIPAGFAHGFQTLSDATEVFYQMGQTFSPEHAQGIRHNDPALDLRWPLPVSVISSKDATYPDYRP